MAGNRCCLCCCKCLASCLTILGLIILAAGIAVFFIFKDDERELQIFELEDDVVQKFQFSVLAIGLMVIGSVIFVVSLCVWCCVCCMTPKSQTGVVLAQPTVVMASPPPAHPGMTYAPSAQPSAPPPPRPPPPQMPPDFQPPPSTASAPPPYTEKAAD